jgi:hypothetical protein
MPTPNAANVTPTPAADSSSVWIAYGHIDRLITNNAVLK